MIKEFCITQKWAIKPEKTWRNLKCMLLSERSQPKKATCCMIPTIWHSGKGKTMEKVKKISGCQGLGGREGWRGGAQSIFRALKVLCVILQWLKPVIIHLSKPIECSTPKVNLKVNCVLWVTILCQCRFTSYNKYATSVGDVDNGGYTRVGTRHLFILLILHFNINLHLSVNVLLLFSF